MKPSTMFLVAALTGTVVWAVVERQRAEELRENNRRLLKELTELQHEQKDLAGQQTGRRDSELERLRAESLELRRLRAEVTDLKRTASQVEILQAQNKRLSDAAAAAQQQQAPIPPPLPPQAEPTPPKRFTRDQWSFAGYASPEASLISAIWAMREGHPQTYLDSLTPEEQARMAKQWEGKDESEVATKQQNDTANISGISVLDTQKTGTDEVTMTVAIEGTDRTEKVIVKQINGNWKFGGFIRAPK